MSVPRLAAEPQVDVTAASLMVAAVLGIIGSPLVLLFCLVRNGWM
ncbi:hypothetical protein [Methylorubrum extorquens]